MLPTDASLFQDFDVMKVYLGTSCACIAAPDLDGDFPGGWCPCPFGLCERPDHKHDICSECGNDLVTFMHEQSCSRSWPSDAPGSSPS